MKKIFVIFIICLMLIIPIKTNVEAFSYPDNVVENVAAVMMSENGCGKRENFIYQLILAADLLNGHYFWNHHNNVTMDSLCYTLKHGWRNDGFYCNLTYARVYGYRYSTCTTEQENQIKLAAKMALSGSFTIPKNVYGAAEQSVVDALNGKVWVRFQPEIWTGYANFFYPGTESLATTDRYGYSVPGDFTFYKNLANCLYNNPTLFGAHNQCPGTAVPETPFKVYLYPEGGTGITEGQVFEYTKTPTKFTEFPTVTKKDCTLDGWNVGAAPPNGKPYYKDVGAGDDGEKLYARWTCKTPSTPEDKKYTITLNKNGGAWSDSTTSSTKKIEYKLNSDGKYYISNFPGVTKNGYNLKGWNESKDGSDKGYYSYINDKTAGKTLYAIWEPKKYTITLNSNGGTPTKNQKITYTLNSDGKYAVSNFKNKVSRTGCEVIGWTTSSSSSSATVYKTYIDATFDNKTIYAKWSCTVTLNANGGKFVNSNDNKKVTYTEDNYPISNFNNRVSKDGCTLNGWHLGSANSTTIYKKYLILDNGGQILYANWKCNPTSYIEDVKTYSITIDANGGKLTGSSTVTYSEDEVPYAISNFNNRVSKEKCTLDGWHVNSKTSTTIYRKWLVAASDGYKLYANWKCDTDTSTDDTPTDEGTEETKKYMVIFKLNDKSNIIYWTETVNENEKVSKPKKDPVMDGYIFKSWTTSNGKDFNFNTKITNNLTLYAKWEEKTGIINPQTGAKKIIVFLILIITSTFGITYYYKKYSESLNQNN